MRGLVYVTYSHETRIRPGLHRLVDLQVFPSQGCAELPDARCSLFRTLGENPVDTATAFETGADMLLHTLPHVDECGGGRHLSAFALCGADGVFHQRLAAELQSAALWHLMGTPCWCGRRRRRRPRATGSRL